MLYGIDISPYQGNIADLGSDIDFVIIKVTQGTDYVSPNWQQQRDVARRDNKIVLYYHFVNQVNNAADETQHFLNTIGSSRQSNEGAVWDWEVGNYSDAVDQAGATFFDLVKQSWGVNTFPYSNAARINSGSWPRLVTRHAPLYEAAYGANPPSPHPFPGIAIWQNTSSGSEQGISGKVDRDIFYGSREQLIQLIGGETMIEDTDDNYRRWALTSQFTRGRYDPAHRVIVPLSRDEFRQAAVGKTWLQALETLEDNDEANAALNMLLIGDQASADNWSGQISDLTQKNKDLQGKLDAVAGPDKIIITKKGFGAVWEALKSFFNKNN